MPLATTPVSPKNRFQKPLLLALLLTAAASSRAGTFASAVTATATTNAIVLSYSAGSACTITAVDGSNIPQNVWDLDPTIFAGANLDLSRTASQGFKWPTQVNGNQRQVVIGGPDVGVSLTGVSYSRALRAATPYTITLACEDGGQATVQVTTQNVMPQDNSPKPPLFDPTAFGNMAQPTVDWTNRDLLYNDPLTGVAIQRITSPLDLAQPSSSGVNKVPTAGIDLSGGAWTAPNGVARGPGKGFALTTTPSAVLFVPWPAPLYVAGAYGPGLILSDIRARLYAKGDPQSVIDICLGDAAGCWTGIQRIKGLTKTPQQFMVPSGFPSPMFAAWGLGPGNTPVLNSPNLANAQTATVDGSGNMITLSAGSQGAFSLDWRPGTLVHIPGCPAPGICTVSQVLNPAMMTVTQTKLNFKAQPLTSFAAGFLVWMEPNPSDPSPTISVSINYDTVIGGQAAAGSSGTMDLCNLNPVTDITTDCKGNPRSPAATGRLCALGGIPLALYLIQDDGQVCLQSSFQGDGSQQKGGVQGNFYGITNGGSPTDPKTFLVTAANNHLYRGTLTNGGNYTEFQPLSPGNNQTFNSDQMTYTDLGTAPLNQLQQKGGEVWQQYIKGNPPESLWGQFGLSGMIGGYTIYTAQPGGQNAPALKLRTDENNNLIQVLDVYKHFPLTWCGYHVSPDGQGPWMRLGCNPLQSFNQAPLLGGPFTVSVVAMHRAQGMVPSTKTVTSVIPGNPTTLVSPDHGLDTYFNQNFGNGPGLGPTVQISNATGSWGVINGVWNATVNNNNTDNFTIPVNTTGLSPSNFTSATLLAAPALSSSTVVSVGGMSPAVVTIYIKEGDENYPPNHGFIDGDAIAFSSLPSNQYYAKVTGYSPTTFGVYRDQNLTQAVSPSELAGTVNGNVYFAETCPPIGTLPPIVQQMTQDPIGPVGPRCITLRIAGPPCSAFASPGEATAYPCAGSNNNSSLKNIEPGDSIQDISRANSDEKFNVLQVTPNGGNGNLDVLLMRFDSQLGTRAPNNNASGTTHDYGWTPQMIPYSAQGWVNVNDPTNTVVLSDPRFYASHSDLGYGSQPGLVTYAGGIADDLMDITMAQFLSARATENRVDSPVFGNTQNEVFTSQLQSYPSHRQTSAAPVSEHVWKGDWAATNPGFGSNPGAGSPLFPMSAYSIACDPNLDPQCSTHFVFATTTPISNFDPKNVAYLAHAGRYLWNDISGPQSLITDTTPSSWCVAYNSGECRPNSVPGTVFFSMRGLNGSPNQYCLSNTLNSAMPCFYGLAVTGGWAIQERISPLDTNSSGTRRLTMGLGTIPDQHYSFQTWISMPDAQSGFFTLPAVNGQFEAYWRVLLPPWTSGDGQNRTSFVNVPVPVSPNPGENLQNARIRFGYAEYGPGQLYCTSRQDSCSTELPINSPVAPYAYMSEARQLTSCSGGCTINVPSLSGRVLCYVVDHLDGSGNVLSSTDPQYATVP